MYFQVEHFQSSQVWNWYIFTVTDGFSKEVTSQVINWCHLQIISNSLPSFHAKLFILHGCYLSPYNDALYWYLYTLKE